MKVFVLLLTAFLPTLALADFGGEWQGSVQATNGQGLNLPCILTMKITQDGNKISIDSHKLACAYFDKEWQVTNLENRGGALFYTDERGPDYSGVIGTISENSLHAKMRSCLAGDFPCQKTAYADYQLKISSNGKLFYQEKWIVKGKPVSMKISGRLTK